MISPFNMYGFIEQRGYESVATQRGAQYKKAAKTADHCDHVASFFREGFGVSPNLDEICGMPCPVEEETSEGAVEEPAASQEEDC